MALHNIMPWADDSGTTPAVSWAPMKSGETFTIGDPVSINSSGQLTQSADDPVVADFAGIAMGPLSYVRGTAYAAGSASTKNPESGAAYAALDMVPYIKALPGRRFISAYFSNGASVLMAPGTTYANATAIAIVGQEVGLQLTSTTWQFDLGMTADNELFRVEAFLDANKRNISRSGQPAVYVVCACLQSQWTGLSDAAGSLAPIA